MFSQTQLREIANMSGSERAFATLYIGVQTKLSAFNKRVENIRALLSTSPTETEHFENNLKLIEQHFATQKHGKHGLCMIVCWALDIVRITTVDVPIPDTLHIGASPYIRPMAEFEDEYENFAVVMADNTDAHIFVVTAAIAEREAGIDGGIKNHVRKGGWSQKRYQRRRDNQLLHYAKEINEKLEVINREREFQRLLLVGSDETLHEIRRELSAVLTDKIAGIKVLDLGSSDSELWKEIYALHFAGEREAERTLLARIREEYCTGGLAVVGVEDVLHAVREGRVDTVLATRDIRIDGVQCNTCGVPALASAQVCTSCTAMEFFPIDILNTLTTLVYTTSATIDFADPLPELGQLGHVAALLRY